MPLPDGMKAAERLRRVDESVCLIFVTNMAQLAIRGYKVGATDFLVKPVSYFDFSMEMDKIVRAHERRANDSIWVSTAGSMRRVAFSDICYIEILMHDVVIHTEKSLLCERHKIRFTYMIDGEQLDFMDPVDIASLFGNALDNAIESVLRTDDGPGGSDSHTLGEGAYRGQPYEDAEEYTGYGARGAPSFLFAAVRICARADGFAQARFFVQDGSRALRKCIQRTKVHKKVRFPC